MQFHAVKVQKNQGGTGRDGEPRTALPSCRVKGLSEEGTASGREARRGSGPGERTGWRGRGWEWASELGFG